MKFSEWVEQSFPGLSMSTVPDAIWWVDFSTAAVEVPADLTHPQNIRQWHREQQPPAAPPWFNADAAPEPAPEVVTVPEATKFSG